MTGHDVEKGADHPFYCGATINGPKVGYHVVAWRKQCRQRVKAPGDRCRFHGGKCPSCGESLYLAPGYVHECPAPPAETGGDR